MQWNAQTRELFRRFHDDPTDPACARDLGRLYWHTLNEGLAIPLREGGDPRDFLEAEKSFLDIGWIREVSGEVDLSSIRNREPSILRVLFLSEWLAGVVGKVLGQDRETTLRSDIETAQARIARVQKDLGQLQDSRWTVLSDTVSDPTAQERAAAARLRQADALLLDVTRWRRAASQGKVSSAEDRRRLVAKEKQLKEAQDVSGALAAAVSLDSARSELRSLSRNIAQLCTSQVVLEETIQRLQAQIDDQKHSREKISPLEMESRVTEETDYLRDLLNLAAKRIRRENCPILRPGDRHFTSSTLYSCLDLVLEFDPRMFHNGRVAFMGKPSVLLTPGNGNALYDWKTNSLVVPLTPPGGNFLESLAGAVIEYRLDVDEEKALINSYCKLPHLKGVRSLIQIKHHFTKDYIAWMVSESQGFKVLTKETRAWFEHEVAPSKYDIYCPAEYLSHDMTQAEFQKSFDEIGSRLARSSLDEAFPSDLWAGCILNFQQGKYDEAFECVKAYVDKEPDAAFGHYNMGQIAMKTSHKQEAVTGFGEFCKRNARSWWAGVAQEHLRRLKA